MNSSILIGILPLLLFVIVDSFAGLKAGLITAVAMAIVEAIYTIAYFGELDSVTVFSLITVLITCYISYKKQSPLFLKFQPVVLSSVFGIILIVSYYIGKPYLLTVMIKYKHLLPANQSINLESEVFKQLYTMSTLTLGIGFQIHALITAVAALKLSNWWWIAIRGIGFYIIMIISFFSSFLLI